MARVIQKRKYAARIKIIKICTAIAVVLLVALAGIYLYKYFFRSKVNNFLVENKYYAFTLQTPKNWIAEGKTIYSEDNIGEILSQCNSDKSGKSSTYEIGRFRFQDQKYPESFGDAGFFPTDYSAGAILDITISCVPDSTKSKLVGYNYGSLQIGGEKAFSAFLNLLGFGNTKYLSFFHNNFQYSVKEYVYKPEAGKNYESVFDKIISGFKFVK